MDGLDCLEAMNQQPKSKPCKVVIVTALNDPEKRRKALNMGAMDYIMKPYIFESLSKSSTKLLLRLLQRKNNLRRCSVA